MTKEIFQTSAILVAIFMAAWVIRGDIADINVGVAKNSVGIIANSVGIAKNSVGIAANSVGIAANSTAISANSSAIAEIRGILLTHIDGHNHTQVSQGLPDKTQSQ